MGAVSIRIELSGREIRRFLRDLRANPKAIEELRTNARRVANTAGRGFDNRQMLRRVNRPGFIAYARTQHAKEEQLRDNRLGRAVAALSRGRPNA
nr:MAG TPA: hypothetical protein [Caudoviricetes sp.]